MNLQYAEYFKLPLEWIEMDLETAELEIWQVQKSRFCHD